MKTINELPPIDLPNIASPALVEFGVDDAGANPKVSRKITLQQIRGFTYDIWPSEDPAIDTPAFESLLRAIPVTGGTIRVMDNAKSLKLSPDYSVAGSSGNVTILADYRGAPIINKPFRLIGESKHSHITLMPKGTVPTLVNAYYLVWGNTTNYYIAGASSQNIDPVTQGWPSIQGYPAGYLKRGDWILVSSNNPIQNVSPHHSKNGGKQFPGELRRVSYIESGTHAFLDGVLIDQYDLFPFIVKLPMLADCGIANLTIGSGRNLANESEFENASSITLAFDVQGTVGFRVENVTIDDTTAGALRVNMSAETVIEGFDSYGVRDSSVDYGVIAMTVNGLTFRDSAWHGSRHVFTTGGNTAANGIDRYGTPENVFVHNVTQYQASSVNNDVLTGFDSHAEGYGVTFDSCRVFAGGYPTTRAHGFGGRSRNMVFRNCSFFDHRGSAGRRNEGYAYVICSHNATIEGGRIEGAAIGVQMRTYNASDPAETIPIYQHECRISNVQFEDVWGSPVLSEVPINGITVDNCSIKNCSSHMSGTGETGPQYTRAAVTLYGGTGHKIRGNFFDRDQNDYILNPYSLGTSAIQIVGNHCYGYTQRFTQGTDKIGIRGDHGDPNGISSAGAQALQVAFEHQNYTS